MDDGTGQDPTQSDVARVAGVSRGLVSLALSGSPSVAPATRERIVKAADRLGYTRNLGAASLAARRSSVMGVVLPDLRNPFFENIVESLQVEAEAAGLLPLIATVSDDQMREAAVLRRLRELRVAGVVVVSPVQSLDDLARAARAMRMVLVGADAAEGSLDSVHVDEAAAARLIVGHARERGRRRVVALAEATGPGEVWVRLRRGALAQAAHDAGLSFEAMRAGEGHTVSQCLHELLREGAGGERGNDARTSREADRLHDVLVAGHNDLIAMDALAALRALGLTPGPDVGVVGFDDTHLARRPEFDITSVSQDDAALARLAVAALTDRKSGVPADSKGREWVVAPLMSVRSSS
jgi:DNA-binding LacI/PurR family transcriptional regulator